MNDIEYRIPTATVNNVGMRGIEEMKEMKMIHFQHKQVVLYLEVE